MHGATQIIYEGTPDYPKPDRYWDIVEKHGATILYTTPTVLRMYIKFGDRIPNSFDLSSLRLLDTAGEPINPEVWMWYFRTIGKENCPILDTWWQTETGSVMISGCTGRPDDKKGESIIGFVVLRTEFVSVSDQQLRNELVNHIRDRVGPIATPEEIYFGNKLPKTRSGKIMRRLLKSISNGSSTSIGDVSTLEDGTSLEEVRQAYDDLHKSIG